MSLKNPLTLAGIEPATFRFVAQHLNHCATAVPRLSTFVMLKYIKRREVHKLASHLTKCIWISNTLTPCNKVILQKLVFSHQIKELLAFCGTMNYIVLFKEVLPITPVLRLFNLLQTVMPCFCKVGLL